MDKKNVLVTGIGGNVGQGIIRNIKRDFGEIRIVGCNTVDFTAGNHLCNAFYKVPYAYEPTYIDTIKQIVTIENIDLIVPSTDYEVYYLSCSQDSIGCRIAVSSPATTGAYLDKYLTYELHKKFNIPFAESCLPSEYKGNFFECIVKPRKGRGSRGIHINPEEVSNFSDEEYLVQELHKGDEITTAFYVTKDNGLHGHITLIRSLENGTTITCAVEKKYDEKLEAILLHLIKQVPVKGACNIQSIVTGNGDIIPFEVNCRISGTNSIRSNFGFKDVKYTLEENLFDLSPSPVTIINGVAVRILMDVIYPDAVNADMLTNNSASSFLF